MSTKTFLSLLLVTAITLTSCKKELEPQESSPVQTAVTPETVNPNAATVASPVQTQQNITAANTTTITPATTAKGMNPAHGQPGHRCDIPAGAPLNSPAGKPKANPVPTQINQSGNYTVTPAAVNANGTVTPSPAITTSSTPAILNPTTTAPGMNPPHGQEGHVCSVAVGAPLPKT